MIKAITIDLLKVAPNGKSIEYMIECPQNYQFDKFNITVRLYDTDTKEWEEKEYSIIDSVLEYVEEYELDATKLTGAIALDAFDIFDSGIVNAMYKIELRAYDTRLIDTDCPDYLEADAWISDVSDAYKCMMEDIMNLLGSDSNPCDSSSYDDLIRKYFILYAHLEAMRQKNIDEASIYFKLLNKCFGNCGSHRSRCGKSLTGCGCGRTSNSTYSSKKSSSSSCGCGK